jgi:hypothetical protein
MCSWTVLIVEFTYGVPPMEQFVRIVDEKGLLVRPGFLPENTLENLLFMRKIPASFLDKPLPPHFGRFSLKTSERLYTMCPASTAGKSPLRVTPSFSRL